MEDLRWLPLKYLVSAVVAETAIMKNLENWENRNVLLANSRPDDVVYFVLK